MIKELHLFDICTAFIDDMNKSSSVNEKVDVLKNCNTEIHNLLFYTYNPYYQYYVSSKNLEKRKDLNNWDHDPSTSLFDLLDMLRNREITGHAAISAANNWLNNNENLRDIFYLILEKNLKIRASVKLINRAIPNLIPTFSVALAEKFDVSLIEKQKIDFKEDTWYVSRKLDGVRCLVFIDEDGNTEVRSRSGKSIDTLTNLEDQLKATGLRSVVFDGEICKTDINDNEDFQGVMKEIGRKKYQMLDYKYFAFDLLSFEEFYSGKSESLFSDRYLSLKDSISTCSNVTALAQGIINSYENLSNIQANIPDSWEGLMIRKNSTYKGKRSKDVYKVKKFYDDEYKVIDITTGPFRYVSDSIEVEENMLSAVIVMHKGYRVNVGSGFTIQQRKHFYDYPENILNKLITVQYFEESQNKQGEFSLRFPVVKMIHGDKREF